MFLHAASIALEHPVDGQPLAFQAPLPDDCAAFLKGFDAARV
jgi:23S rRNA pseudouridine955/2504/2580 synthase